MADIAIRDVRKSYGRNEVVHGVSVDIADGEFVVILGPSGCGKSTLLRMVAGLERITSGGIEIAGHRVNDLAPRERGCAMVFQNYALYPHMTVAENIGYALKVSGVPRRERRRKVEETAAILGLAGYLERKPSELSGGQRQRVAMGRAIIREPQVFLFDEPLSNLDAKLRVQMRVEIRRLHRRLGATSIFVTHDQVEAMTLADRLIVMNNGLIEQVGRPADVYDRPATRFVGEFIGSPPMAFVTARTAEAGRLRLPDGGALPMPPCASGLAAGIEVHAGVRAENLIVTTAPGSDMPRARVEFFEELGPARLLHLDLAGTAIVAQVDKAMDVAPGSTVGVTAEAGHVHLFDPVSGRVLADGGMAAARAA